MYLRRHIIQRTRSLKIVVNWLRFSSKSQRRLSKSQPVQNSGPDNYVLEVVRANHQPLVRVQGREPAPRPLHSSISPAHAHTTRTGVYGEAPARTTNRRGAAACAPCDKLGSAHNDIGASRGGQGVVVRVSGRRCLSQHGEVNRAVPAAPHCQGRPSRRGAEPSSQSTTPGIPRHSPHTWP
jgi:hypothetical protein